MSGDLYAVGHVGVVVAARIMFAGLVGTGGVVATWGPAPFSRADPCFKNEALALPGAELLLGQIDLGAFLSFDDIEVTVLDGDFGDGTILFAGDFRSRLGEINKADEIGAIGEGAEELGRDCCAVENDLAALVIDGRGPCEVISGFLEREKSSLLVDREGDGFRGGRGHAGHRKGKDCSKGEEGKEFHGGENGDAQNYVCDTVTQADFLWGVRIAQQLK